MKFFTLSLFILLAFVSCQKSIEDKPLMSLIGNYDFLGITENRSSIEIDSSGGTIVKTTRIDTFVTYEHSGTLEINANQFIISEWKNTGSSYLKIIREESGQQPTIFESTEEVGWGDPVSYPCDYRLKGIDSVAIYNSVDPQTGSIDPSSQTDHYRFAGDTLILTYKKISYESDPELHFSSNETYTNQLKFKRKK